MTEIVLHIGADKTGTTAVQRALAELRPALVERRVWYPDLDGRPDHRILASAPATPLPVPGGVDTVVLSAEALWSLDSRAIAELLGALPSGPVTVIGYVRDPVAHAEAAFGQRLRLARSERELSALLALRAVPARLNPIVGRARRRLAQLDRWRAAVDARPGGGAREPAPRLVVRPYDPAVDVVTDLCRAVGLDRLVPLLADRDRPRPNTGVGLVAIHASVLVRARSGPEAQTRFLDAFAGPATAGSAPTDLLPPGLQRRIRHRTEPLLDGLGLAPDRERPSRSRGADGPVQRLDRAAALALIEEVWPGFPSGSPGRSD